jgi:fatty-acid desaturase
MPLAQTSTARDVDWPVVGGIAAMHLGCVLAPFHVTAGAVWVMVALIWLAGGVGVTLGFHRLLTHRSFRCPLWLEHGLTVLGCLSWQGGAIQWVGTHRLHHQSPDRDEDPHSPRHGFLWSHMLWPMLKEPAGRCAADAAKDLARDPVHRFLDHWFWVPQALLVPVLYALGGLPWVVWGIFVRTTIVYHGTWLVNSAGHRFGYRNFDTRDDSGNVWWVALLTFGEGWHNNHHAHQSAAAHGVRWFELDLTYAQIRLLGLLRLARGITPHSGLTRRPLRGSEPVPRSSEC